MYQLLFCLSAPNLPLTDLLIIMTLKCFSSGEHQKNTIEKDIFSSSTVFSSLLISIMVCCSPSQVSEAPHKWPQVSSAVNSQLASEFHRHHLESFQKSFVGTSISTLLTWQSQHTAFPSSKIYESQLGEDSLSRLSLVHILYFRVVVASYI